MSDRYKRHKINHEREQKEIQERISKEKKKESQAVMIPVILLEEVKRHLQTKIPYAPHGEEKVSRDSEDRIVKHHLHSTELPFDKHHDLWHKLDDLQKVSPIIDLETIPVDDPELIDPKTLEDPPSAAKIPKMTPISKKELEKLKDE